jgi:hypothetical protein
VFKSSKILRCRFESREKNWHERIGMTFARFMPNGEEMTPLSLMPSCQHLADYVVFRYSNTSPRIWIISENPEINSGTFSDIQNQ